MARELEARLDSILEPLTEHTPGHRALKQDEEFLQKLRTLGYLQ